MEIALNNFLLNTLKHHFPSQIAFVMEARTEGFYKSLLKLGGSQMDVYLGGLSVQVIMKDCINGLISNGIVSYDNYLEKILQNGGFFTTTISDGSKWVFRLGDQPEKYVHIHPGRYSPFTMRVKANQLKTVLCLLFEGITSIDIDVVNTIRKERLSLSPIKSLNENLGIEALWKYYWGNMNST